MEEMAQALLVLEKVYFGESGNIEHCQLIGREIDIL
jgi:hypothetical protein